MATTAVTCAKCGTALTPHSAAAPCPVCRSLDRDAFDEDAARLTERVSSLSKTRQYWERRPLLLTALIVIVLGSPLLGLVLAGWPGVAIGLLLSLLSLGLGFFAVTRVRHTENSVFRDDDA